MKNKISNLILAFSTLLFLFSCSGPKGKDVSKDPKYADVYNGFFVPTQTLYYYDYTHSRGDKSGYVLSKFTDVERAKLIEEIPVSETKVIIHKVLEIEGKDGTVNVIVKGKVFPNFKHEGHSFMASWEDIKTALLRK
ncbi:MAG: hypothetical protein Q4G16_05035 [Cruoricaptor ignavus]|nr:hypothetical protein [Cruoricaptor ignavus]